MEREAVLPPGGALTMNTPVLPCSLVNHAPHRTLDGDAKNVIPSQHDLMKFRYLECKMFGRVTRAKLIRKFHAIYESYARIIQFGTGNSYPHIDCLQSSFRFSRGLPTLLQRAGERRVDHERLLGSLACLANPSPQASRIVSASVMKWRTLIRRHTREGQCMDAPYLFERILMSSRIPNYLRLFCLKVGHEGSVNTLMLVGIPGGDSAFCVSRSRRYQVARARLCIRS